MDDAKMSTNVLPGLLRVAERAKREPETRMFALAHHVDEEQRFGDILKAFPLPRPSIRVQRWAKLT